MKIVHLAPVLLVSFILAACGGGGGSSDDMMTGNGGGGGGGGGDTCPAGETGTPPNCMPAGPSVEELTKRADTKRKAIAAEAAQTVANDGGLGGSADDGTPVTTYNMTIERDRDGTTVKITDSGLAGDDDPKFMQEMDLGGGTTMHVRTMKADSDGDVVSEVVMVTTDIQAPRAVPFAMWQAMDGTMPQELDVLSTTGVAATGDATDNALGIDPDTDLTGDANANLMFARSTTSGTLNYTFNDADTTGVDEALHDGTYNGAEGTYRCTGTNTCTVTFNDKGAVVGNTGGWVFIPDTGATSDQPDYDYLHYGFWLQRTTDSDGVLEYDEVETFAGSSVARSDTASVTGKATYSGGATGVYVHSVKNPDGSEASATSGHFTADVALTAYFGQTVDDASTTNVDESGQIAPSLVNSISGTIDNFMLAGHSQGPGWSVTLEQTATDGTGTDPHVDNGVAKGGGADGSYTATFHGPTADTDNNPIQPHTVVGEFNANFVNGSVAGGFGARRD